LIQIALEESDASQLTRFALAAVYSVWIDDCAERPALRW
jgi:hypothetical protein